MIMAPIRPSVQATTTSLTGRPPMINRPFGRATLAAAAVAVGVVLAAAGCTTQDEPSSSRVDVSTSPSAKQANVSVKVEWTRVGEFYGEPQVAYVIRVGNPADKPQSVALQVTVLDAEGTIIGTTDGQTPNIDTGDSFDLFGAVGGGVYAELKGEPDTIEAQRVDGDPGTATTPRLETSDVKLTKARPDESSDAPRAYDMAAKVTNTSGQPVQGGVTQQVVLYDKHGKVVGGDSGSSDDVPTNLGKGQSYRESWTGIPAEKRAERAVYTVWTYRVASTPSCSTGPWC